MHKVNVTEVRARLFNKFIVKVVTSNTTPEGFLIPTAEVSLWDAIGNRQLSWEYIHLIDLESCIRDIVPDYMFEDAWKVIKIAIETNDTK